VDVVKQAQRRVVAVVVHYGDPQPTVRSVQSHWSLNVFSEIVVVANDLSAKPVELEPYSCTWLIPSRNVGFGGGCQLAASTCDADVYAFFNAHVTIDGPSVERCVAGFADEQVGISAPCVYHPDRRNPARGWRYSRSLRTYSRLLRMPIQIPLGSNCIEGSADELGLIDNDWATGGAIFCRDKVITEVGWDGSYFLTFEDVDICLRAKRCGWRIVLVSPAIAFHNGESTRSSAMSAYYGMRNALWFARRFHSKSIQALTTIFLCVLLFRIAVADRLKRRRPSHAALAIRGLRDGWLLLPASHEVLPGEPLPRS
jgi:N-acetylglucosaminyl-diphospho-decaprenol L-rhamnosyltransferase